jgi:hypothetical protein
MADASPDSPGRQREFDFQRSAQLRILECAELPQRDHQGKRFNNRGAAKSLLKAIDSYARKNGKCFASMKRLAKNTGCSVKTARRLYHRLVGMQFISVLVQHRSNGTYAAHYTAINWVKLLDAVPAEEQKKIRAGAKQRPPPVKTRGANLGVPPPNLGVPPPNLGVPPPQLGSTHKRNLSAGLNEMHDGDAFQKSLLKTQGKSVPTEPGSEEIRCWGRDHWLTKAELRDPRIVSELFAYACERGWFQPTDFDRARFFGLVAYALRNKKNPGGYLTICCSQHWTKAKADIPSEETASAQLSALNREAIAVGASCAMTASIGNLFAVAEPPKPKPITTAAELSAELERRRLKRLAATND